MSPEQANIEQQVTAPQTPVNLQDDFEEETPAIEKPLRNFKIRENLQRDIDNVLQGDIEDVDDEEEEAIVQKQDGLDAVQRFIPMEIPTNVKETLERLFYDES